MIRIGEFSKLAKTTVKTLRFYDEIGLFRPLFVDDNGYRYYDIGQLNDLTRIVRLRALGFPIGSVREIVSGGDVRAAFSLRLRELEEERNRLDERILLLRKYAAKAEKGDFMEKYEAQEIELPKGIVYCRKGVIPTMADLFSFILEAGAEAKAHNPDLKCLGYCYVVYGAKEYKEENVEVEYAEMVEARGVDSENICFKQIYPQKAVAVTHTGSYAKLGEAYAFALNWVKERGYEIAAPVREVYVDGCWNKDSEEEYRTQIQIPVR